jgi:hypothetical protein
MRFSIFSSDVFAGSYTTVSIFVSTFHTADFTPFPIAAASMRGLQRLAQTPNTLNETSVSSGALVSTCEKAGDTEAARRRRIIYLINFILVRLLDKHRKDQLPVLIINR